MIRISSWPVLILGLSSLVFGARFLQQPLPDLRTADQPLTDLTLHLVCHTHDDVGWLKTVDQYYTGSKSGIQEARVQFILDSVMDSLAKDPKRKFIYVEIAFFSRWWRDQTPQRQQQVRDFVKSGQLEFINGGWCMNDEAAVDYQSVVDQMTRGHEFLLREFGVTPRIGWHIDPFGHSATQASLFASMGFDAFMFGRIDYQDKDSRLKNQELEMVWRPSASLGSDNEIFTVVTYNGYNPPGGFCFDIHCFDDPLQNDKNLFDYDLDTRAADFADQIRKQAASTRGTDIMLTMGSDFQYEYAEEWFKNLDILIEYFNRPENLEKYKLHLKYSTPSEYLQSRHSLDHVWNVKTDDFFPYADGQHAFWTGYFTSRAGFKGYARQMNGYLQVCKMIETVRNLNEGVSQVIPSSRRLSEALAVSQHHDSISGTAKQHVNDDYTKRLFLGQVGCDLLIGDFLSQYAVSSSNDTEAPKFKRCNYLNISICSPTESITDSNPVTAMIINTLGQSRDEYVAFPVNTPDVEVFDESGNRVPSSVLPLSNDTYRARLNVDEKSIATHTLWFKPRVGELSITSYSLRKTVRYDRLSSISKSSNDPLVVSNDYFSISFDVSTGRIAKLTNKKADKSISLDQNWFFYKSSPGTREDSQASGAYIFRPAYQEAIVESKTVENEIVTSSLVTEVRQKFSGIASQIVRVFPDKPYVEIEYTLGPIDLSDNWGKEYVSRFTTNLNSNKEFYTDSNGREILKRIRDFRPTWNLTLKEPVSGNYFPVNSRIFLRDEQSNLQFTILNDRSQGGSSLKDGEMELMVHRRTVKDDGRGVDEPLNEDIVVRGKFYLLLDEIEPSTEFHRMFAEKVAHPVESFFGVQTSPVRSLPQTKKLFAEASSKMPKLWDLVGNTLREDDQDTPTGFPENIHLMTFETMADGSVLLRLSHTFAIGESTKYSIPVTVDVKEILGCDIVDELSLSANQPLSKMQRLKWKTADNEIPKVKSTSKSLSGNTITLNPMEIRTYLLKC